MKKIITIVTLAFFLQGCGLYYSRPVTNGVIEKEINLGMTKKEVYSKLGAPSYVGKRQFDGKGFAQVGMDDRSIIVDTDGPGSVEVWVYNEYAPKPVYVILGILSLGVGLLFSPDPEPQNLYFKGDILQAWDVFVPFIPEKEVGKPQT